MAATYTTRSGDAWDLISWRLYGSERYMGILIQANVKLAHVLRFDAGTVITVPDIPAEDSQVLPFWHSTDDNTIWGKEAE